MKNYRQIDLVVLSLLAESYAVFNYVVLAFTMISFVL